MTLGVLLKKRINKKERSAFSLVEVITVLLVISLGMVGTLSLISQNIRSQSINEKTMIAYQLAQEGIELIRNLRDTNVNNGDDWRTGMLTDGEYVMDYTDDMPPMLFITDQSKLKIDANGMYYHNLDYGTDSGFSRIISIVAATEDRDMDYISVTARVYWEDHGKNYNYFLETWLFNWR